MKALILAGGRGTRLGKLTKAVPKPLLKIAGKTVLEYQIELLRKYAVREIIVLISHLGHKIKDYLGNGKKWGVTISYLEEIKPLGTAGGVKKIEQSLLDDFLVLYGDVLLNVDLARFIRHHIKNKANDPQCVGTLMTHPNNHPWDSDLVEIGEGNKIIKFLSKPHPDSLLYRNIVNGGLYILSPKICTHISKDQASDFGRDIFPAIVQNKTHALYAYHSPEYLKDMGTPHRLHEAEQDVKNHRYQRDTFEVKKSAVFLDRDGVINKEVDQLCRVDDFELIAGSAEAIKKLNENGLYVVVVTNQPMVAKGFCTYNDILEIHKKMETELGRIGAKLDGIYFCPHHPEKGFAGENPEFKRRCDCRKPAIGMLRQAAADLNIDSKQSYLVSDSTTDAQAAKNAGVDFIGVKTGYGCEDAKYPVKIPRQLVKENLLAAANYILRKEKEKKSHDHI